MDGKSNGGKRGNSFSNGPASAQDEQMKALNAAQVTFWDLL